MGLRVCAHGFHFCQEASGPVDDVGGVVEGGLEGGFVGEEGGVLEDGEDLAEEGDGFLIELLRVADIGGDDGIEGEGLVGVGGRSRWVVGGLQLSAVCLCSGGKFAWMMELSAMDSRRSLSRYWTFATMDGRIFVG